MARVFLDTNFVVETIGLRRSKKESKNLGGHETYISPLTIHIMCYAFKVDIPDKRISDFISQMYLVDFTDKLTNLASSGPTEDFEDNVQLHSAVEAKCDYFLTKDEELLKMKFFGKIKIVDRL